MDEVLLFGGGLDSYPAWHRLGHPPALYVDLGHRYAAQERAAVAALAQVSGMEVTISDELRLAAWEAPDAIIPMRNVHLAMVAANRAPIVWCIGVKGDHTLDKSPEAFADISAFITRLSGRAVRVGSPFWAWTKTEIVTWYLAEGLPVDHLMMTFSCSRGDGATSHCGRCSSCLRRWISLVNNGIDGAFDTPPSEWDRVHSYYIPAMREGRYPEHRARELFTALNIAGVTTHRRGGSSR
jgi:7-cyano-7-deazaguanine synthase